jgi:hypothetical protein
LPLAWVVCGVGIAFFAYEKLISTGATNGVEGTYSFGERIIEWTYFLSDLRTKQVSEILLGQGLVQGEGGKGYQAIVPVDNLYLGFVLHIGVLGLAVVANLFRKLWLRAQELAREGKTDIGIASAAMFSTVFAVGIFANDYATLDVLLLLAFISGTDTSEQDKCEV